MAVWHCREKEIEYGSKVLLMGIVNVTPDSFSDGGDWLDPATALTHARAAVLAWSLLYIFRVVLYTFWLMALLALVAAACLASSVSAAATAA